MEISVDSGNYIHEQGKDFLRDLEQCNSMTVLFSPLVMMSPVSQPLWALSSHLTWVRALSLRVKVMPRKRKLRY